MSLLSVLAGAFAFFAAATVGLWIKKKAIRKAVFYEEYYEYLQYVSEKISYERMPIGELNANYFKKKNGLFAAYLRGEMSACPLREEEINEVKAYLDTIGTTDADTQIASLGAKCAELKRFTETSCVKYRKDGALQFKLAVLVGIALFILLV